MEIISNKCTLLLLCNTCNQDVLFGRGFTINTHPGNKQLRSIIQAQKPTFLKVKKNEKRNVARGIVDMIENLDPPGRFLMEDPNFPDVGSDGLISDKVWIFVDNREKAVDKIMHRLREKVGTSGEYLARSGAEAPYYYSNNNSLLLIQLNQLQ